MGIFEWGNIQQCLQLALHSGIIPVPTLGTIWGAGVLRGGTQFGHMQRKCRIHCIIAPALTISSVFCSFTRSAMLGRLLTVPQALANQMKYYATCDFFTPRTWAFQCCLFCLIFSDLAIFD